MNIRGSVVNLKQPMQNRSAPQIQSKLPRTGTTIFTEMSALARAHDAVNLSQGFPDFECADALKEAISKAVKDGHNQYSPMPGIMPLRERISEKTQALYGRYYHPEKEITVVPGATIAIFTAITAVVHPGDEVIIIEPAYDCYVPAVELSGGICVFSSLKAPGFEIDWEDIRNKITPKTRLIVVNSPHNPGTSVMKPEDLQMLDALTRDTSILVISDEVYEHIIFDGVAHQSAALMESLSSRTFIVSSFGKTYHVTGWKTGYVLAPPSMTTEFRKVHQYNDFCSFAPAQWAFYEMLGNPESYHSVAAFYQEKRDTMKNLLRGSKFKVLHSAGSYFQLLDYSAYSTEKDYDLARRLTIEHRIATIPLSSFFHDHKDLKLLRICFAKNESTLQQAAHILNNLS